MSFALFLALIPTTDEAQSLSAPPSETPTAAAAPAQEFWLNGPHRPVWIRARLDVGTLGVLSHDIQFGKNGTQFNYVTEGGQNNLYLYLRAEAEAVLAQRHSIVLVYQPINVVTESTLQNDLQVYETKFNAGTPMRFRYGFDFVRLSYLFDLLPSDNDELSVGAGLQLRNAVIDFGAQDGSAFISNRNIGPVPLLAGRARFTADDGPLAGMFWGGEVSGFWASGRIITGSLNDFEGAILDTQLKAGVPIARFADVYLAARVIGGGARGVEEDSDEGGDGFTNNWLWTGILSVGAELR